MDFAFSTTVTTQKINKGEKFTKQNLWVKRPGHFGMPADMYEDVLGKIAARDFYPDEHVLEKDIC